MLEDSIENCNGQPLSANVNRSCDLHDIVMYESEKYNSYKYIIIVTKIKKKVPDNRHMEDSCLVERIKHVNKEHEHKIKISYLI